MGNRVFNIAEDNKLYKNLESSRNKGVYFLRDFFLVGFGLPSVIYLLADKSPINGIYFYTSFDYAILIAILYVVIAYIFNLYKFYKYLNVSNTFITKINDKIIIYQVIDMRNKGVFTELYGASLINKSKSFLDSAAQSLSNEVMNELDLIEKPDIFIKNIYTNCKFIKEKKKYYVFSGVSNGKLTKFKIYKIYENINQITMEAI